MNDNLPTHSRYGASGAHRWVACPGSVRLQAAAPAEEPSVYAQYGTAAHALAAHCLIGKHDTARFIGHTVEDVEVDEEMAAAVQLYIDVIRKDNGSDIIVERKFHITELHPEFFGTCDCVGWGKSADSLVVYDAKFGAGEIVEVVRPDGRPNIQLGFYALGAISDLKRTAKVKHLSNITSVELVIVQPRAWHKDGPVRRAKFPIGRITALGQELLEAVKRCEESHPALVPGPHCKFCRAAGTCPALRDQSFAVAQLEFDEVGPEQIRPAVNALTPQQMSDILYAAELIETWLEAVRARAHIMAESQSIPGWKLVAKQARRKWIDEDKAANALMHDFGLDEDVIYKTELKSPAQAEKLLKPKDRQTMEFKNLCPAVSSGLVLVRDSNPRLEVIPSQVTYDDGTSTSEETEW